MFNLARRSEAPPNFREKMLRPKMTPFKTFQEAAEATDEMLAAAAQMGELCHHDFSIAR